MMATRAPSFFREKPSNPPITPGSRPPFSPAVAYEGQVLLGCLSIIKPRTVESILGNHSRRFGRCRHFLAFQCNGHHLVPKARSPSPVFQMPQTDILFPFAAFFCSKMDPFICLIMSWNPNYSSPNNCHMSHFNRPPSFFRPKPHYERPALPGSASKFASYSRNNLFYRIMDTMLDLCKKYAFFDREIRLYLYFLLGTVSAFLGRALEPLPRFYLTQKRNILNDYVVKLGKLKKGGN